MQVPNALERKLYVKYLQRRPFNVREACRLVAHRRSRRARTRATATATAAAGSSGGGSGFLSKLFGNDASKEEAAAAAAAAAAAEEEMSAEELAAEAEAAKGGCDLQSTHCSRSRGCAVNSATNRFQNFTRRLLCISMRPRHILVKGGLGCVRVSSNANCRAPAPLDLYDGVLIEQCRPLL